MGISKFSPRKYLVRSMSRFFAYSLIVIFLFFFFFIVCIVVGFCIFVKVVYWLLSSVVKITRRLF